MYQTIISVTDLAQNLNQPNWVVVDCRFRLSDLAFGRNAHQTAHIPGAVYAHLDDDLSGEIFPGTTGRHPLPNEANLAQTLSNWGIDETVQVVAYDDLGDCGPVVVARALAGARCGHRVRWWLASMASRATTDLKRNTAI